MSALSVDLGTSNTVAVLSAHGRPPRLVEMDGGQNMPSAIFADRLRCDALQPLRHRAPRHKLSRRFGR